MKDVNKFHTDLALLGIEISLDQLEKMCNLYWIVKKPRGVEEHEN